MKVVRFHETRICTDDQQRLLVAHSCTRSPLPNSAAYIAIMNAEPSHNTNPLHGITLERMLNELVEHIGWERMGRRVKIACFTSDPSIASSLKFLRRTPWARAKVETMYLEARARKSQHDARKAAGQSIDRHSDDEQPHVTDTPTE